MAQTRRGESFVMQSGEPRPIDFGAFLLGLASTALVHLGAAPHPETGQRAADLALARESIDLLVLLRDKTRGNLTADEEQMFESLLADLRFRFVEAQRK